MNWFLIALIPPALWSLTNHFDKFLISRFFKGGGVGALMVFSSIIGFFLLPIIFIFNPNVFSLTFSTALLISINGMLYVLAILPYFHALDKDEASIVVPLFQMIPVISYFLGIIILGETLTSNQILASVVIIFGAIAISLDLTQYRKIKIKLDVLGLMFLSSLLFALNFLFFKYFALQQSFWVTAFWEYVGFGIFAIFLMLFVKSYRNQFFEVLKKNRTLVIGINGLNEIINIIAKISFNFATLLAPVTLIWVVNGLQPMFVFLYGVLFTLFFPKFSEENISKKILFQKLISIMIITIGACLLNY
jgi:uncharacterized membrane protein